MRLKLHTHPQILQLFFMSSMPWLSCPFWRGRKGKKKRKMGQVERRESRRDRWG